MTASRAQTTRLVVGAAAVAAIAGFGLNSLASSALFTDQQSTGAATLSTGTIAITLGGDYTTAFPTSGMMPGDSKYGTITVLNGGNESRLSAAATWGTANALSAATEITMVEIASTDTCDAAAVSGGTALNASTTTAGTTLAMFGDSATGQDAGDQTLAASDTKYYCVQLALPSATGNSVKSLTTDLSFTFDAEQTANNTPTPTTT